MQVNQINKEEINKHLNDFRYFIIYYFDRLEYGEGEHEFEIEKINEAFLFDEDKCMHIYREDGVNAILYIYDSNDKVIVEEQIAKKSKKFKSLKSIIVHKVINTEDDEDGQAYIERVLPAKLLFV